MPTVPETFLMLSSTAWTALSSIATFLVVLVALFLPFYQERKKRKNLIELIKDEIKSNSETLEVAQKNKDMAPAILREINLNIWEDHKQNLANISSNDYLEFKKINTMFHYLKKDAELIHSIDKDAVLARLIDTSEQLYKLLKNKKYITTPAEAGDPATGPRST